MNQMQMYFMMMKKRDIEPITEPLIIRERGFPEPDNLVAAMFSLDENWYAVRTKSTAYSLTPTRFMACTTFYSRYIVWRGFFMINTPSHKVKGVTINAHKDHNGTVFEDCYLYTSSSYGTLALEDFGSIGDQISERTSAIGDNITIHFNQTGIDIVNAHRGALSLMLRTYRDVEGGPAPIDDSAGYLSGLRASSATVTFTF